MKNGRKYRVASQQETQLAEMQTLSQGGSISVSRSLEMIFPVIVSLIR